MTIQNILKNVFKNVFETISINNLILLQCNVSQKLQLNLWMLYFQLTIYLTAVAIS